MVLCGDFLDFRKNAAVIRKFLVDILINLHNEYPENSLGKVN
jgi:hypothetical protein